MRYAILLILLSGCSAVDSTDPVIYHERVAHTSESETTVIDRTHEIIKDDRITFWVLAGTRIVIDSEGVHASPLPVHRRPLAPIAGNKYHALDTGACYNIDAGEMLLIRLCDPDPLRPSIIVEAYP